MMRHALPFLCRGFGRADVQAAIDLHRIDGDDFAADPLCQRQRSAGFSNGSRAGDDDPT